LDPAVLRQLVAGIPAVHQLLIDGLQAACLVEASARDWLSELGVAVTTPTLRRHLDQLSGEIGNNLEQMQRALAYFGVSHDVGHTPSAPDISSELPLHQPAGALFDLAASVAICRDRAAILSFYTTLQDLAGEAGLAEPLPLLRACATSARKGWVELTRFSVAELVPAAARWNGASLPGTLIHPVFAAASDAAVEAR
jgi:hypothetical protein